MQLWSGSPTVALAAILFVSSVAALAQTQMPEWQKAAGGKMEFDVASVRLDAGEFKPPSVAMSIDDGMQPKDGVSR